MNSSLSGPAKAFQPAFYENSQEKLIAKLYGLKKKFELMYYGKAECKKYEKARAFTIAINAALYEANQFQSHEETLRWKQQSTDSENTKIHSETYMTPTGNCVEQIRSNIRELEKELDDLIS